MRKRERIEEEKQRALEAEEVDEAKMNMLVFCSIVLCTFLCKNFCTYIFNKISLNLVPVIHMTLRLNRPPSIMFHSKL